jgi:hypothetical protein
MLDQDRLPVQISSGCEMIHSNRRKEQQQQVRAVCEWTGSWMRSEGDDETRTDGDWCL